MSGHHNPPAKRRGIVPLVCWILQLAESAVFLWFAVARHIGHRL